MVSRGSANARVTIVTNGNFFARVAIGHLFRATAGRMDFQVFVTSGLRRQRGNRLGEMLSLARRWGGAYTLYKVATYLLPAALGWLTRQPAFVPALCNLHGIAIRRARNVNGPACLNLIRTFGPDIVVSFSCPYRICPALLSIPRIGCLNAHSSLLPAYAGVCTYIHVLANDERLTGMTIHEMVEEFDAGRIVEQVPIPIPAQTSVFALFAHQCEIGGDLLARAIDRCLTAGKIDGIPQDRRDRTYYREPEHADIAALHACGHRLLGYSDLRVLRDLLKR